MGGQLVWDVEPDTVEELSSKLESAIAKGHFIPAELATVKGSRDEWLRLYAEVIPAVTIA